MTEKGEGSFESPKQQKSYQVDGWREGQEREAKELLISGDISAGELTELIKKAFPNTPMEELLVAATYDQEIYIGPKNKQKENEVEK